MNDPWPGYMHIQGPVETVWEYTVEAFHPGYVGKIQREKPQAEDVPVTHVYLSTGCLHGDHDYCRSPQGDGGRTKRPAECKFCQTPCICSCHKEA